MGDGERSGKVFPGFLAHYLRPTQAANRLSGIMHGVGPLELHLLQVMWRLKSATVREVLESERDRELALTTIASTLDRLFHKGLLNRTSGLKKSYLYTPRYTEEELTSALVGEYVHDLLKTSASPELPLSYLVDAVTKTDARLLDELEKMLEKKRQELKAALGPGD